MSPSSVITLSAHELQDQLTAGDLTSVALVRHFMAQMNKHNHAGARLNAIISACPEDIALARARELDTERKEGRIRSNLHGIPVVIKDAVVTGPELGMVTSAGSPAIASLKAKRNAGIVDKLTRAGLIVLGKANMTEFCGHKSNNTPMGWSTSGGQTRSAYCRQDLEEADQPIAGGSSSGSAVSIAAGFSPLALGTETGGSNVFPASLSGLYAMTLSRGSVPTDGVFKISQTFDAIGVMARDPVDLVALSEILLAPSGQLQEHFGLGLETKKLGWQGLSIGVVQSTWGVDETAAKEKWNTPEVKEIYEAATLKLESSGARVVYPLNVTLPAVLKHGADNLMTVAYYEFLDQIQVFIRDNFEADPKLTSLRDIVAWNEEHASQALPEPYTTQTELIASLNSTMTQATHATAAAAIRRLAREEAGRVMDEQALDIMMSPSDANLVSYAACAGWPIATVPLAQLKRNGQPWGFFAMARDGREDVLLRFMGAFKAAFEPLERPAMSYA